MEHPNTDTQKKRLEEFLADLEFSYKQLQNCSIQDKRYKAFLECKKLLEKAKDIQKQIDTNSIDVSMDSAGLIGLLQIRFKKKVLKISK